MQTLTLAWRNLWRNWKRTLVSLSAVGLGLALVIFFGGLMAGILGDAKNQLDSSGMGHLELTGKGWRTHRAVGDVLSDPEGVRARLQLPPGAEVSTRVVLRGLLSSSHGNEAVELHGVDFADEVRVAEYAHQVVQGAAPAAGDPRGLLVGEELARRLQLQVGSKVKVLVQRADGELGAELFKVRGVFHAITSGLSRHRVLLDRPAAAQLAGIRGAHQIVIQLDRAADADLLAPRLQAALGGEVEVRTYSQLFPTFKALEAYADSAIVYASIFVYLLVGLGILNTTLMSVLERTREFGVMQALGTRPAGILAMVLAESFWIGSIAIVFGLALGLGLTWYGSTTSILDYSKVMGEGLETGGVVMRSAFVTRFSPAQGAQAAAAVYAMALLVGLFPAWRVSRMHPVEALHAR
jgi:ABC-type lipoprotein release transport system permease subunit